MFETDRLFFRAMTDDDEQDFYEIFKSDKVNLFVKKMTWEQVKKYFEKQKTKAPNPYSFAVILKKTNKMIGTIALKEKEPNIGSLSYVFHDQYWNNGFATESVQFMINHAFKDWAFNEIKADCQFDNLPSNRILQKFGFQFMFSNEDNISHIFNKNVKFNFYSLKK